VTREELDAAITDGVARYGSNPLGFVRYAFPWSEPGELQKDSGPRVWQTEILGLIGSHLKNPATRFTPLRVAVASGHGIGKSALVSMIVNWALSTHEDTRIVVTANTEGQLRTKTWPEVTKWVRLSINGDWWETPGLSVYSNEKGHDKNWRADATAWSEHNTEAFAGLHNVGKRLVLIFDEASNIANNVWEVSEGALTDENTEIIWLAFGNPTRNTGRFKDCFSRYRHLWNTRQIDSRTVEGTNKAYLDEMVATYGEDSDIVKVRIRGMFPSMSVKQFISVEDVDKAFGKHLRPEQFNFAPKILTVDPAWEGDDPMVIAIRQGLSFRILRKIPKNDNDIQMANLIAQLEDVEQADAVFIDAGYGTGIVSAGRTFGRNWQLVWFGGESTDPGCFNKRAEMWKLGRDWLKAGGSIPPDRELYDDLIGPETVPRVDGKILLESKKDMKARGLPSPNKGDALMLSFAYPVLARNGPRSLQGAHNGNRADYDPFAKKLR
jgi:hypothetical protein